MMAKKKAPADETLPLYLTRVEAARALRVSDRTLDKLVKTKQIKAKKHGHATMIHRSEIERYWDELPDWSPLPWKARRRR